MSCPQCGAPKRSKPIDGEKIVNVLHIIAFSLFTVGVVLLAVSGFSDAWLVSDLPTEIDGVEMQYGLTHLAIDCSDVDDSDERNICKLSAKIYLSGQDFETYLENNTIESEDDLQKLTKDLPEKQSVLIADMCQLEGFDSADSDECEEIVDAGFVATACGIASIMLGVTAVLIAFLNKIMFNINESSSTAITLAFCSNLIAIVGFFAWIILLPEDTFDGSSGIVTIETGWAFGLAIAGLSTMTFSVLMMIGEIIGSKMSKATQIS